MENVVIIGDGVAGLAAAVYAARADLSPLVITGYESGGQLMWTTEVENYPGFSEGILGPALIEQMRMQAERFGARYLYKRVESISGEEMDFTIDLGDEKIKTKTIILASGASARTLGLPEEKDFFGRGLSTCATCDGAFTRDKDVVVIGGGDSAMEESLFLSKFARSVTIVHRRSEFRASQIMQRRVLDHPKISVIWNHDLVGMKGDGSLSHAVIEDVASKERKEVETSFIFYAIGHIPNTDFLAGMVDLEAQGTIRTDELQRTNVPGIFAAGDVQDHIFRQAITAAGTGAAAAISVERYLSHKG